MAKTIGNPLSWIGQAFGGTARQVGEWSGAVGGDEAVAPPEVREIGVKDIREALRAGARDFAASRADVLYLVIVYPVIGLLLAAVGFQMSLLPLIFPLVAGFAIVGPVAAVGVYEISRRREAGEEVSWAAALRVVERPNFAAIAVLGAMLVGLFLLWLLAAWTIYAATLGPEPPATVGAFLGDVFGTGAGWALIILGCGVGFLFAITALAVSVVSFPLLLDRPVGVPTAVATSIEVFRRNPRTVCLWGLIVAAALTVGAIPFLIGMIIVLPLLGHATWHLYRRAVH